MSARGPPGGFLESESAGDNPDPHHRGSPRADPSVHLKLSLQRHVVGRFARASLDLLGLLPEAGRDTLDVICSLLEPAGLEQVYIPPDGDRSTDGKCNA
ncbi:hypothetical protein E5288_WYG003203 [Bos mutus]|uniref:Uncharacterized protein n=1 Tax=Bos mutus TaxID=72004 RepID=A0A6B0R7X0_9CETA|nr:hypothetical protein [Bos mutus]